MANPEIAASAPFNIAVEDPNPQLRELHLSFTDAFKQMTVEQRLESLRSYIESLVKQSPAMKDIASQKGVMTIIQITEQLLPHIQADNMPLDETLIVEMGEGAEGSTLDELLS